MDNTVTQNTAILEIIKLTPYRTTKVSRVVSTEANALAAAASNFAKRLVCVEATPSGVRSNYDEVDCHLMKCPH